MYLYFLLEPLVRLLIVIYTHAHTHTHTYICTHAYTHTHITHNIYMHTTHTNMDCDWDTVTISVVSSTVGPTLD